MDLYGVELFRTGRWNDIKNFTTEDLDGMAQSFADLSMAGRVPLKFGHNTDQPITDGQPALGWLSKVYRKEDKLLGDFTSMPRVVYDAVKAGAYKFVSIEMLRDVTFNGQEFPWVLTAVALLGADIPAVRGLKDLQTLAMSRRSAMPTGVRVTFTRNVTTNGDHANMETEKDLGKRLDALSAKVETFSAENATLKGENESLRTKLSDQEKAYKKEKVDAHRAAIDLRFTAAIRSKVIAANARKMFEDSARFKDDASVLSISLDEVDEHIRQFKLPGSGSVNMSQGGGTDRQAGNGPEGEEGLAPGEIVVKRVDHLMGTNLQFSNKSRTEVTNFVLRSDAALAEAYRSEPGVKGGKE